MCQYSAHVLRLSELEFESSGRLFGVEEISREDTGWHLGCDINTGTTFTYPYG